MKLCFVLTIFFSAIIFTVHVNSMSTNNIAARAHDRKIFHILLATGSINP